MKITSNVKKDFLWNIIGSVCSALTFPVIIIVVIRFNGIDEAGSASFAFSLAMMFYSIGIYGGRFYQVSDVKNEFDDNTYILFRFTTTMFMPILCMAFMLLGNYDKLTNMLLIIFTLIKMSLSISDAFYGVIQKENKFYIIGMSLFYRFLFGIGFFAVINFATRDIRLAALVMFIANLACTVFYDFRKARHRVQLAFLHRMAPKLKNLAGKSLCLAIFLFAPILAMNIPRFFMAQIDDQAYFSIFTVPTTLFSMIVMLMINPTLVDLSNRIHNNDTSVAETIKRLILYVGVVAALALILAYYIGIQILTAVYGIDFAGYRNILLLSIISGALSGLAYIFILILNIMRRFVQVIQIYITCILILSLSSFFTVGEYGLIAAIFVYLAYNAVSLFLFGLYYVADLTRLSRSTANK